MPLGLIGEKIIMLDHYVMMSGCVELMTGESEMKMPTKLESRPALVSSTTGSLLHKYQTPECNFCKKAPPKVKFLEHGI